jgi:hypothetical protein
MHGVISETATILGAALLNFADDSGRFKVQFEALRGQLLTFRKTFSKPPEEAFAELEMVGYLKTYRAPGFDMPLCQIVTFGRHQNIDRKRPSTLPPPPEEAESSQQRTLAQLCASDKRTLAEYSPSQQRTLAQPCASDKRTLGEDSPGKEGRKGEEGVSEPARAREAHTPSLAEVLEFAEGKKIAADCATKFFQEKESVGWRHKGEEVRNWRILLEAFWESWKKMDGAAPGKNGARLAELDQELLTETDPGKRAEIRKEIKSLKANT